MSVTEEDRKKEDKAMEARNKNGEYFNETEDATAVIRKYHEHLIEKHFGGKTDKYGTEVYYRNEVGSLVRNYNDMLNSFRSTAYEHNEMSLTIRHLERKIRRMVWFVNHLRHWEMCRKSCPCMTCVNCEADKVWAEEQLDQYDDEKKKKEPSGGNRG